MPGSRSSSSVMAGRAKFTGRRALCGSGFGSGEHRLAGGDVEGLRARFHFEAAAFAAFHDLDDQLVNRPRVLQELFRVLAERGVVQVDFHGPSICNGARMAGPVPDSMGALPSWLK